MGWFTSKPKPKRRRPPAPTRAGASLDAYIKTYGAKDGRTVFEASQIKAKRKGKR